MRVLGAGSKSTSLLTSSLVLPHNTYTNNHPALVSNTAPKMLALAHRAAVVAHTGLLATTTGKATSRLVPSAPLRIPRTTARYASSTRAYAAASSAGGEANTSNDASKRKVALVTGGASGIGRAACLEFAKQGVRVVVSDVNEAGAHETLEQAGGAGSGCVCRADMADEGDVKALIDHIRATYGRLDYALDNAGIEGESALTADCPTDAFDKVMSVNARGVFLCLKHQIPLMLQTAQEEEEERNKPAIVITSSVAGISGIEGMCPYVASKHAVLGLMRTAAAEYGPQGLRVNAILPAATDTPMLTRAAAKLPKEDALGTVLSGASYPLRRIATAQEEAEVAVWLCMGASFVTGQALVVDGGFTCCI